MSSNPARVRHVTLLTAWRALNKSKLERGIEDDKSFMLLKNYLLTLANNNAETATSLKCAADGTFKRTFLCLRASQLEFKHCRPMVVADACHLRSQYGGVVMSACAHDGEGKIVPLAIGIADIENEDNWTYFLRQLRSAMPELGNPGMAVVHDREKGLHNAKTSVLPSSHESVCVFHLEKNVNALFKSKFLGNIWAAAKATTVVDFEATMQDIERMNVEAASYLRGANPAMWAASMSPVPRFGCTTSN